MAFWGGLSQGLAQGVQIGQQMKLQKEEHQLKAKMLEFQMKKMEQEQRDQEQQQRGMADYQQAITQGVPDQFGGPVQGPIEASGRLPAQPAPQRQATPQELYGLSLRAVRPQDAYHLIQQQQKATLPGQANQAMDIPTALQFMQSPEYQQLFKTGATPQQTSKGITFRGVNPVNVASNAYHREMATSGDPIKAQEAANRALYELSASQGAGTQLGGAAATMGTPIPQPPAMSRPQGQMSGIPGIPGQPQPMTQASQPSNESLPLQAARAKANITRESAAIPESADSAITSMRTLLGQLDKVNPKNPQTLYDPKFVGPIASKVGAAKETLGQTPIIGDLIGGPISEKEAQFRQVVNSIYNEIANLRGGKVLPEQELRRIEQEAVTLSKSPASFEARYSGFRNMVESMLRNRINAVGASRSTIGNPATQPQGLPPPPTGWR